MKLKKGHLTNIECRGQKGKPYQSMSIRGGVFKYRPQQKNCQQERIANYRPQQEKMGTASSIRKRLTPATQPKKSCHHLELLLFSEGLSFKTISPDFLLLHKITFLCLLNLRMVLLELANPELQFSGLPR